MEKSNRLGVANSPEETLWLGMQHNSVNPLEKYALFGDPIKVE